VLEDAFAGLKTQVQAIESGVAFFELVHHAQALQVVLEAAVSGHAFVQGVLPGMTKRRVAQVMRQGDGFHQVLVQAQGPRDRTAQLRHFQRMRHARAKEVTLVVQKYLGLVDQAPERGRVDDAVAVALESIARGRRQLRVTSAPGLQGVAGPRGQARGVLDIRHSRR